MDLIVCMKRVPDSAAKIRVADDGKTIDPSGVDYVISPYDEMALEKSLQLKEEHEGTVSVICTRRRSRSDCWSGSRSCLPGPNVAASWRIQAPRRSKQR